MFKLIIVHLFLLSVPVAKSLFAGEPCVKEGVSGICNLLSECQPLVAEMHRAGNPLPPFMTLKLQTLTCGFVSEQPLVCCPSSEAKPSNNGSSGTRDVNIPQVPSRRKPVQSENSKVEGSNKIINSSKEERNEQNISQKPLNENKEDESSEILINDGIPDVRKHRNLRLLPTGCGLASGVRIFGGNMTRLYEMPWMILISYISGRGTFLDCGGTLISERYVLTAAHCVTYLINKKLDSIILGEHDITQDPDCEIVQGMKDCAPNVMNVKIEKVIAHPGYKLQTQFDDIALVRLSQPANFSLDNMKPICLPTTPQLQRELLVGYDGSVVGWGFTEKGLPSSVLLQVALPVISNSDCRTTYNNTLHIYETQMCAGGIKGKDACGGDSGGPILYPGRTDAGIRSVQRGIVSHGTQRCGIEGFPGIFTNIAYYMDWILDNMSD